MSCRYANLGSLRGVCIAPFAAETLTKTDQRRLEAFELWICRRMEKISWLDKVTNKKVLKRVHEVGQANTEHLFSKGNIDSLAMF